MALDKHALMFTKESVAETNDPNARLMRIIFVDRGITNYTFLQRYRDFYAETHPHLSQQQHNQKAATDRRFVMHPTRVTPKMCQIVLAVMGFIIQKSDFGERESSVEILDTRSGRVLQFSSEQSLT